MLNSLQLKNEMAQYYGTEHYYRHLGFSKYLYTDGVKGFAEKAEAYWFIYDVFAALVRMKNDFIEIHLNVKEEKGEIIFKDCGKIIKKIYVPFTDCPEGDWVFFYDNINKVLMWCEEY